MTSTQPGTLNRLSDTGQTVADPAEDIRGRIVHDAEGTEIGTVDDLLVDAQQHKVRFLRVKHGGILGFGATPSFIPVEAVSRITDEVVSIDQLRHRVADAPAYDPDLIVEPDQYSGLYKYYGYTPFWGSGYIYPGYPYSR